MPITGTVGNAFVTIALQGFAQVQSQIAALKSATTSFAKSNSESFKNLSVSVSSLGAIFTQASGAVRGFAAVADPRGALQLELAFLRLQIAVGRFFIPIVRAAGEAVNRLADYLDAMSDDTRESVLRFAKLALAVTASGRGWRCSGGSSRKSPPSWVRWSAR